MSDDTAPGITGIHHFSVTARDIEASVAAYQRVFRAPTTFSSSSLRSADTS